MNAGERGNDLAALVCEEIDVEDDIGRHVGWADPETNGDLNDANKTQTNEDSCHLPGLQGDPRGRAAECAVFEVLPETTEEVNDASLC